MGTKFVKISFEIELAKKITSGESEGSIMTHIGNDVRIICFDRNSDDKPIIALVDEIGIESVQEYTKDGRLSDECTDDYDLLMKIPTKRKLTTKGMNLFEAYTTDFLYPADDIVTCILKISIKTGINNITYDRGGYYIVISFNNGIKAELWNCNKWYAWASSSIFYKDDVEIYRATSCRPSRKVIWLLSKSISKYIESKYK